MLDFLHHMWSHSWQASEPNGRLTASFAAGRYIINDIVGDTDKKRVYLAHDDLLDSAVACTLFRTDGTGFTGNAAAGDVSRYAK